MCRVVGVTTRPPSLLDGEGAGYRRSLEQALSEHLAIVQQHAAGGDHSTPWEFEAALVALRWIADELRTISLSDEDVPF
jgi:hypothetical protein